MSQRFSLDIQELINSLALHRAVDCITPKDNRYENARLVYNRMHDCYPRLIVRTLDVDVLRMVMDFSFKNQIVLAIRGGGHHIGGFGTCNNGILIDFSPFKKIDIDIKQNIVSIEPGVRLHDLDRALTRAGFVIPTGTVSDTGMAGLTLGGGIGWLTGKYGLACDQLCGADVLLADGQLIRAEDPEHQELLWALRGGGGNFGLVLKFRYTLNPLPKTICGMGVVPWEHVNAVMQELLLYLDNACPQSITVAPIFTRDSMSNPYLRIDFCCADASTDELEQLLSMSKWVEWGEVKEWSFVDWQCVSDKAFLPPLRGYWKASYIEKITPNIIKKLCDSFENAPTPRYAILIEHLHGAFKQYDQSTSAFPLRHCNFGILLAARWEHADDDLKNIDWVRQSFNAIDPDAMTASYLNYTDADDQRAVDTLILSTTSRIANVKALYDPDNCFKRNHNILPINKKTTTLSRSKDGVY